MPPLDGNFDPRELEPASDAKLYLTPMSVERPVLIDAIDYEWLSQWRWTLHINQRGNPYPARQAGSYRFGTRQRIYLHRAVLIRAVGPPPTRDRVIADHINGDVFDARRANLRWVTRRENALNTQKFRERTGEPYVCAAIERYFLRMSALQQEQRESD